MGRWLANVFRLGLKEFASLASDKGLAFFTMSEEPLPLPGRADRPPTAFRR